MRFVIVGLVVVAGLAGCSSGPDGAEAYCATVERTAVAYATPDAAVKRPAMMERADAAPPEIAEDWATVVALEAGDPTLRRLAQERVDAFEVEHC